MKNSASFISAALAALVLCAAASASADPVGGEKTDRDLLRPDQGVRYTVVLRAKETTIVNVNGDGNGDIDCAIYDENGNMITSDYSGRDGCSMSVTPAWTGEFFVRLINNGDESSIYDLRIW